MKRIWFGTALVAFVLAISFPQAPYAAQEAATGGGGQRGNADQADRRPRNLQVLPKNLTPQQIIPIMQEIAAGLGVTCDHCHVARGEQQFNNPMAAFDFASDEKPPKKIARTMMVMVREINTKLAAELGKPANQVTQVRCVTCHRGLETPSATPRTLL